MRNSCFSVDLYLHGYHDRTMVEFEEPGPVRRKIGIQGTGPERTPWWWGWACQLEYCLRCCQITPDLLRLHRSFTSTTESDEARIRAEKKMPL